MQLTERGPTRMNIEKLKHLVEVANSESITVAADRLFISQPSLSQSIISIENELGVKIFKRSKKGTFATEVGVEIINKARKIVRHSEELKRVASQTYEQITGTITIATIPSFCMSFLLKAISNYKNRFPGIEINVAEGGSYFVKKQVMLDKADVGLLSTSDNFIKEEDNLIFEPLIHSKVKVIVNKDSSLSFKKKLHPEEIVKYPLVTFNEDYRMHHFVRKTLEPYGKPRIFLTTTNPEVMKKAILEDLAIGFYAEIALKDDLYVNNGSIIPLDIVAENNSLRVFGLLHKTSNDYIPYHIKEFFNELEIQSAAFENKHNISTVNK